MAQENDHLTGVSRKGVAFTFRHCGDSPQLGTRKTERHPHSEWLVYVTAAAADSEAFGWKSVLRGAVNRDADRLPRSTTCAEHAVATPIT